MLTQFSVLLQSSSLSLQLSRFSYGGLLWIVGLLKKCWEPKLFDIDSLAGDIDSFGR